MFQYAAARRLAYRHRTHLKLDVVPLVQNAYRHYALNCFSIQQSLATDLDVFQVWPLEGLRRIFSKIVGRRLSGLFFKKIIKDRSGYVVQRYYRYDSTSEDVCSLMIGRILSQRFFHFDPEVLDAPDGVYMAGSFISEKYFADIKPIILKEFRFVGKVSDEDEEEKVTKMIRCSESVSIHIRRGDFTENPQNRVAYNIIGNDYYNACVNYLAKRLKSPKFFVFSDDMDWVKTNFKIPYPTYYIENNYHSLDHRIGHKMDFQDMRLMSECQHNIIANSSFSWWGAWLNQNPRRIVCAPKEFVRISNFDNKDIVPDEWIKF